MSLELEGVRASRSQQGALTKVTWVGYQQRLLPPLCAPCGTYCLTESGYYVPNILDP